MLIIVFKRSSSRPYSLEWRNNQAQIMATSTARVKPKIVIRDRQIGMQCANTRSAA